MTRRLFLPRDAAALAVGADEVAAAIQPEAAGQAIELVRTGSRGMLWLEPLLEVAIDGVRHGFGPLEAEDVKDLVGRGLLAGNTARLFGHPKSLGPVEQIDYLARQTRLTFSRCGIIDPLSLEDYRATGGYAGLTRALSLTPVAIVDEVTKSGLRGRGGAGFPTGIKWKTVLEAKSRSEVPRLQCRRGRQRHVRRSHADGRRPLHAHRRDDHCRPRRRGDPRLHLRAVRVSARDRDAAQRDRDREEGGPARRRRRWLDARVRSRGTSRRGRVRVR